VEAGLMKKVKVKFTIPLCDKSIGVLMERLRGEDYTIYTGAKEAIEDNACLNIERFLSLAFSSSKPYLHADLTRDGIAVTLSVGTNRRVGRQELVELTQRLQNSYRGIQPYPLTHISIGLDSMVNMYHEGMEFGIEMPLKNLGPGL